jgi:hypothetical protein
VIDASLRRRTPINERRYSKEQLAKAMHKVVAYAKCMRSLTAPTIEDAVKAGGFLAGRSEDIIEQLKAVERRYPGLDRVICATPLGTPLGDLDRFAKEVIPAFRDTTTAAAAH